MLGPSNKDGPIKTAKDIILKLNTGNMELFDTCAGGKFKYKSVPNKSKPRIETNNGARIYIDIQTIREQET